MDVRDYALQEDTGYSNGARMTEVKGPQSHRKPIEVKHYYAGCRVDGAPVYAENRCVEPERRQLSTRLMFVNDFLGIIAQHALTVLYVQEFFRQNPREQLSEFMANNDITDWVCSAFIWPDEYVSEFGALYDAWDNFLKERGIYAEV